MPVDVEVIPNSKDVDETEKITPAINDEKKNADDTELVSGRNQRLICIYSWSKVKNWKYLRIHLFTNYYSIPIKDAETVKENGDAKEIVNGNGTIDSCQRNISEEHQNIYEDHTTDKTSTSEPIPSVTNNIDDQDTNIESKPVETGSNDENTTNIIESINDAMKENDEATHDKNIEIIVKEECSEIQEKDVLHCFQSKLRYFHISKHCLRWEFLLFVLPQAQ